jgi:hypothetical protein
VDGKLEMWFARDTGFAMVKSSISEPELPDDDILGDEFGGDADVITELFKSGGFEIVNHENCADGCSLEFHCLGDVTIDELDAFARDNGFIDDPDYKKYVSI